MDVIISYIRERLHTEAAHPLAEGHHVANSAISWPPLQLSLEWGDIARFLLREVDVNCVTLIQSIQKLRFVSHSQPIQRSPPPFVFKGTAHPKMQIQSLSTQAPPAQLDSRVKFHSRQNVSGASPQGSPKQLR